MAQQKPSSASHDRHPRVILLIAREVILVKLDRCGQPEDVECSWQGCSNISVEEKDRCEILRRFGIYTLLHSGGKLVLLNPFEDESLADLFPD